MRDFALLQPQLGVVLNCQPGTAMARDAARAHQCARAALHEHASPACCHTTLFTANDTLHHCQLCLRTHPHAAVDDAVLEDPCCAAAHVEATRRGAVPIVSGGRSTISGHWLHRLRRKAQREAADGAAPGICNDRRTDCGGRRPVGPLGTGSH